MSREVDFLVVASLDDEAKFALSHFGYEVARGREYLGSVSRIGGGTYGVAVLNVAGMGPADAQRETSAALVRMLVHNVILVGVAAGFPEKGVGYGDLMIPEYIAQYAKGKVVEGQDEQGAVVTSLQRRGYPNCVSRPLWHAAHTLAEAPDEPWLKRLTVKRPDGSAGGPSVFCQPLSVIGSGPYVIASEHSADRAWLVQELHAIGLEMEAAGVYESCSEQNIPLLVIKASQDPALAEKDSPGKRDKWRDYACDVAASFAREFITRFELSKPQFTSEFLASVAKLVRTDTAKALPEFNYTVSVAQSFSELKRQSFLSERQALDTVLPNDESRFIALVAGGGTGKTRIARKVFNRIASDEERCPVLLNLKRYKQNEHEQVSSKPDSSEQLILERLIAECSSPQCNVPDLRRLAEETQVDVVIDGLNEVPGNEQELLLTFVRELGPDGRKARTLVTARLGDATAERLRIFRFVTVDRLSMDEISALYDGRYGVNAFDQLHDRVKRILTRPFFIALALRSRNFAGLRSWTEIFTQFFAEHLGIGADILALIAQACFLSLDDAGGLDVAKFRGQIGERIYKTLLDGEVIAQDEKDFEHELWRDFLSSHHLATGADLWIGEHFDRITVDASSFEALPLALEQMKTVEEADRFVKAVYDWNLRGAVECLSRETVAEHGDATTSHGVRLAILAAIADKRFDKVQRTRERAETQLLELKDKIPIAGEAQVQADRDGLFKLLASKNISETWFQHWLAAFTGSASIGDQLTDVVSPDSLIGWAAANALKRAAISAADQAVLRSRFENPQSGDTVRWRILHILGAYPSAENIALLGRALREDPYDWARYGAARSLMECAASAPTSERALAIGEVNNSLPVLRKDSLKIRSRILTEVVEAAFVRGASKEWRAAASPLLKLAVSLAEAETRDELQARLATFEQN